MIIVTPFCCRFAIRFVPSANGDPSDASPTIVVRGHLNTFCLVTAPVDPGRSGFGMFLGEITQKMSDIQQGLVSMSRYVSHHPTVGDISSPTDM